MVEFFKGYVVIGNVLIIGSFGEDGVLNVVGVDNVKVLCLVFDSVYLVMGFDFVGIIQGQVVGCGIGEGVVVVFIVIVQVECLVIVFMLLLLMVLIFVVEQLIQFSRYIV